MKYTFKDILNEDIYKNCDLAVITGRNHIFIDMVIDTLKDLVDSETNELTTSELDGEFNVREEEYSGNFVDIDTFKDVIGSPSINGRWVCICDYKSLNKKQKGYIDLYKRKTSNLGLLIVYSTDFVDYRNMLKDNIMRMSLRSHIFDLSFPHWATLKEIINSIFESKGKRIEVNALELFTIKIGKAYDNLYELVDLVIDESGGPCISNLDVKRAMKGIENFTIDDFIEQMLQPLKNDSTNNKKIYRIMASMMDEYGSLKLAKRMLSTVNELIEFREHINKGTIPVKINYIYNDCIKEIGKDSKISKYSEYRFRKLAMTAAQTSLEDLVYIKIILMKAVRAYNDEERFELLYDIVTRSVLNDNIIDNIIGVDNIMDNQCKYIDSITIIGEQK